MPKHVDLRQLVLRSLESSRREVLDVGHEPVAGEHLLRRQREHLDHVVVNQSVEPDRIVVELLERALAVFGRAAPVVPEERQRPFHRVSHHAHRGELVAEQLTGPDREVTGDDPNSRRAAGGSAREDD